MIYRVGELVVHCRLCYVGDLRSACRCDRYFITVLQCGFCCACPFCHCYGVLLVTEGYGVLVQRMCCSVVLPAICAGRDLQFCLVLGDLQRSDRLGDAVVAPHCCRSFACAFFSLEYDRVAVRLRADFCDRSCCHEVCCLAVLIPCYASGCCQRAAVILLARIRRAYSQCRGRYAQCADCFYLLTILVAICYRVSEFVGNITFCHMRNRRHSLNLFDHVRVDD